MQAVETIIRGGELLIFELQQADYKKVFSLVDGKKETKVLLLSVLSGNNAGRVFVDNINAPKTALIWVLGNVFYFLGDSGNNNFLGSINEFIDTTIATMSRNLVNPNAQFETLIYHNDWQQVLDKLFQNRKLTKNSVDDSDYMFTFNKEHYFSSKVKQITLPEGYVIKKVCNDTITTESTQILRKDILDFWESVDKFLQIGFGYCVIKDNKAVAICFSAYVHEHYHEIAIRTYVQEERRKGLATMVGRAYLDYCVENGLIPAWSTQHTNTVSHAVAEKLGFEFHSKLPSIMFPYRHQ